MTGKLIIFWDFDAQWGAERSRSGGGPKNWGALEFPNTERLLELHAQAGIPACFAVVGEVALPGERPYHDPRLVRRIAEAGHEVASQAMKHEWLPALDRPALVQVLRDSKDALEQCIAAPVKTFVPPFNQPFDFPARGSFSLSERREVPQNRTDLPGLCRGLRECGYDFVRVAYTRPVDRIKTLLKSSRNGHPAHPETIQGITALRLNSHAGFNQDTLTLIENTMNQGGYAIAYGHPHSLSLSSAQSERFFLPFLEQVKAWVAEARLQVILPSQLCIS